MQFLDERLPARFWEKCIPEPNTGCWLWVGGTSPDGYGLYNRVATRVGRTGGGAHRAAYLALVGPIPDGLQLDHRVCRTRCCVNPAHLEVVTQQENIRRGRSGEFAAMRAAAVTHCPKGHAYDEANTRLKKHKGGWLCRDCRTCHRERERGRRKHAA